MNVTPMSSSSASPPSGWRYYGGWFFFVVSFVMPLLSPLIPLLGLSKTSTAFLMGGLLLGGPEITIIIAIALWGKQTFDYFMGYVVRWFKGFAPSYKVSVVRYYVGLALLIGSSIPSWVIAYFPTLLSNTTRIYTVVICDLIFVISFFVLGGAFWDKVRVLFIADK